MSPRRPDLVDVWVFRVAEGSGPPAGRLEILLMRRSAAKVLTGLWQGVSGALDQGESIVAAALRELAEETGIQGDAIEAFYHLDQVNQFLWSDGDAIYTSVVFAVRVRPSVEPLLSSEHDEMRWVPADEALSLSVWPAYRESIDRIERNLLDPELARWFQLGLDGKRMVD